MIPNLLENEWGIQHRGVSTTKLQMKLTPAEIIVKIIWVGDIAINKSET